MTVPVNGAAIEIAPPAGPEDWEWLAALWRERWGGESMVVQGRVHQLRELEARIARLDGERVGAATFCLEERDCELVSLDALAEGKGVGSTLLGAVEGAARAAGCHRLWLITTNDNLDALRFYQRRGYRLAALYPGAVDEARKQKPTIPTMGYHGIPLHDELELEKRF